MLSEDPLKAVFDQENLVRSAAYNQAKSTKNKEPSQFDKYVKAAQKLVSSDQDWTYDEMCEVLDGAYEEPKSQLNLFDSHISQSHRSNA